MSERTPRTLRYMKSTALDHERLVYANYFHDLIQNYGVDCTYYRHDVQFPNKIDLTPGLSGLESLIYGERDSMSYYLSGDMIVYIEIENDIFELNRFGLLPQENITMYFTVEDFNHKFAPQLGAKKLFTDTLITTGTWDNVFTPHIDFVADGVLSGSISTTVSGVVGTTVEISSFDVHFDTSAGYQIPINPYIHASKDYTVSGGSYMAMANGSITFDTVSSFTCNANVGVLYYEPIANSKYHTNIMPQVGDIFRMSFFDDNHEEFEITQIADKSITPDGISPLLGKYIWKCAAVRRVSSYEDVIGRDAEEGTAYKDEIQNAESWAIEKITDTITDYTSGDDDVYGGYENDDPVYVPANDYISGDTVSGTLFEFDYGPAYLATDEYNLYFINESSEVTKLTDDDHVTATVPSQVIGMKYFRTDHENLFFVNKDGTSWQLTDNFREDPYLSSITDFSMAVRMPGDMPTKGMFLVLDNNMILFTDGNNLFCVNDEFDTSQMTSN